jgi:hypothetical protein
MPQEQITRQVETAQLAPDALVFINGDEKLADKDGNIYYIRNDITDINTSLNIDSTPGTAGFTISIPDHKIQRYSKDKVIDANTKKSILYQSLKIMSEVEIYMKGRFPREKEDKTLEYPYYPIFWGVITSITENYSDGSHNVSVSCADILRWWQITNMVFNPSIVSSKEQFFVENPDLTKDKQDTYMQGGVIQTDGRDLTIYANIFANKNAFEIMHELSKTSMRDILPLLNSLDAAISTPDKIGFNLTETALKEIMLYWEKRLSQIGRNLRMYGVHFEEVEVTRTNADKTTSIVKEYKIFFDSDFSKVYPYTLDVKAPDTFESEIKSKLDIANEIKDVLQFEFFMDVNGEIIFKPPFYNLNVIQNNNSVIRDLDIVSWSFTQSESEICTRCDVTGIWKTSQSGADVSGSIGKETVKGIAIDDKLAKRYGIRLQERHITRLNKKEECLNYAFGELNRINALARQGTVSIIGRPELRLGYPIFIPSRNAFYYVKGIDHSISFGGSCQTTLSLVAERRQTPDKYEIFRSVGEIEDTAITTEGNSEADDMSKDLTNNFLKRITDACVPSKRKRKVAVEPDFISASNNVASSKQGTWEKFTNINLNNTFDATKEYQTTDGDGFELIPFFGYGLGLSYSEESAVENEIVDRTAQSNMKNASLAQNISPKGVELLINPNNKAMTLDNENTSMLNLFDSSNMTKAEKAKNMDVRN